MIVNPLWEKSLLLFFMTTYLWKDKFSQAYCLHLNACVSYPHPAGWFPREGQRSGSAPGFFLSLSLPECRLCAELNVPNVSRYQSACLLLDSAASTWRLTPRWPWAHQTRECMHARTPFHALAGGTRRREHELQRSRLIGRLQTGEGVRCTMSSGNKTPLWSDAHTRRLALRLPGKIFSLLQSHEQPISVVAFLFC